ncbi:MAG: hypothetical protein KatS3mg091_445 [Patescibacteria group bacterium]|nr:MAG: hypothetical protein KatS3mg091_445 [Patescibacteria group bacterium]
MKIPAGLRSEIKEIVLKKLNQEQNKAVIYTASKLTESEIDKIVKAIPELSGKEIKQIIDESIISGFKVVIGTTVYDYTLNFKLSSLKRINI